MRDDLKMTTETKKRQEEIHQQEIQNLEVYKGEYERILK